MFTFFIWLPALARFFDKIGPRLEAMGFWQNDKRTDIEGGFLHDIEKMYLSPSAISRIKEMSGVPVRPLTCTLLSAVSIADWSVWTRHVEHAIVGGDGLLVAARLRRLIRATPGNLPVSIAIFQTGQFSGAPLATLQDRDLRSRILERSPGLFEPGLEDPAAVVNDAWARLRPFLAERGVRGVIATERVMAARQHPGGPVLLVIAKDRDRGLLPGIKPSAVLDPGAGKMREAPGSCGIYGRSERLFQGAAQALRAGLDGLLESPRAGKRYCDVIIARRVDVLSDFVSIRRNEAARDHCTGAMSREIGANVFSLAEEVPNSVGKAVESWLRDFALAADAPIFP